MTDIAHVERELQMVNSLLVSRQLYLVCASHLEDLKLAIEQQLRTLREQTLAAVAKAK